MINAADHPGDRVEQAAVADARHAFMFGANCYVQQQSNLKAYVGMIHDLITFW